MNNKIKKEKSPRKNKNIYVFKNFLLGYFYKILFYLLLLVFLIFNSYITLLILKKRTPLAYEFDNQNLMFDQNPMHNIYSSQKQEMDNWEFFSFMDLERNEIKSFKIILDDFKHLVHLKITFAFEKNNFDLKKELKERSFEIQDEIIHLISSKSIQEINNFEEREIYLKKEILNTSNLKINFGSIEGIFITDFFISKID